MADKNFRVKHGINIDTQRLVDVNKNIDAGVTTATSLRVTGLTTVGIISAVTNNNRMGVVTFQSIVAIESGAQTITIAPPSQTAGFVSSYTLTLPNKLGTDGQVLSLGKNGLLGFTTAGLYENRFYVSSANGDDANDGRSKPVKTIKKAAQLASFRSFQIPGGRYLDAGNLLQINKEFIQEEVVAYTEFNFAGITSSVSYNRETCKRDVGYIVDAIAYDIAYGGNSKSIEAGNAYWNAGASYVENEKAETIFAYNYVKFLGQYVINNQTPPTLYQTAVSQVFDFTVIDDPLNVGQNRYRDARNLILGNKQELVDRSLASVAVGYPSAFYFPGDTQTNVRSRYYDSYGLIQRNKQEIVDKSLASIAVGYPTGFVFPGEPQTSNRSRYYDSYRLIINNKREIVDKSLASIAVGFSTFYFPGDTQTNARSRYFDAYRLIYLNKQEIVDKALGQVAIGFSDFYVPNDGQTGIGSTSARSRYYDAYRLIQQNRQTIIDYAYAGIATAYPAFTNPDPNKCKRDIGYFVDAVSTDTFTGGNNYARTFASYYFNGVGIGSLAGEEQQTIYAFRYAGQLMNEALTNRLPIKDLTVSIGASTYQGSGGNVANTSPTACSDVQSNVTSLVGIVTACIGAGTTSSLPSANLGNFDLTGIGVTNPRGIRKCARDLGYFVDAIAIDVFTGGNSYSSDFTQFYFNGAGIAITNGLVGEEAQSVLAFQSAGSLMKQAITNQLNYQNRSITADPVTGFNTSPSSCANVQSNITTLVGIVTAVISAGSTSGLPTQNYGYFASVGVGTTSSPGGFKCARDLGYLVDAVATDLFTGGNNYSRTFVSKYFNNGSPISNGLVGEESQSVYSFQAASNYMKLAITNNLNYQNLGITSDPVYSYNRSTASCANVQSTISSLVGIITASVGVGTTSNLPTENLGYYNISVGIGSTVTGGGTKCARDLGYFVDAISLDLFTGGNNYARNFIFQYVNAGITNSLSGEEPQSIYAFRSAGDYMKKAITNQLNDRVLGITSDPVTGDKFSPNSCSAVQSTIGTLVGIVTTIVGSGSTTGITTANLGYFVVNSTDPVGSNVGIGSTNVKGGRKCARDLGYIIDAVAQDINYGTNQHILYATKSYFNGAGIALTSGLFGEEAQSVQAFETLKINAKKAVANQLYYRDLSILPDPITGVNTDPAGCSNVQSEISTLVGILTAAVSSGSLAGIPTTNLGTADCADVRSALVSNVGVITSIIGIGTTADITLNLPSTRSKPIAIFVEAGEYEEDNPILLYEDVAVVGDNLRNTIIRPANAGVDLFRVRNGCYVTAFAMKDNIDQAGIPRFTFNYAVAFDDPTDTSVSRIGYATKTSKPIISRSPYVQNCSILSFLGANGILVDGDKVQVPNTTIIPEESETPVTGAQPEFGKSMVAAAFTMISFGGIGWRTINDGYAQVVSCFQIFCRYGSLTQSGGYLSITNSATNFGLYALRSTGYSKNSFVFDRGRIVATGTYSGYQTLTAVGLGRSDQNLYVMKFINPAGADVTSSFKPIVTKAEFSPNVGVNTSTNVITIIAHPFQNGDTVIYEGDENSDPVRVIGGLISNNQYYVGILDTDNIQLYEDSTLTRAVDLKTAPTGINTISKGNQEFIVKEIIDGHNDYQELTLLTPSGVFPQFTAGKEITQSVAGGTAVGYALTCVGIGTTIAKLLVSVESSGLVKRNFAVTGVGGASQINDHRSPVAVGFAVTSSVGISTYWTINYTVDSTVPGNTIAGIGSLPIVYRVNFNRPSIINANSHAWEYSGSGIDYNALPQNGGKTVTSSEQVSEQGGRVFSTGTNELGDFKVGNFITAYNRTGNIIFNNKVTIGQLDSLRLSLSGGIVIEEFSTDPTIGDNEQGGAQNKRVSTQLAVRTFLNNRLGDFIDKNVSANAVPSAIVQLNNSGQINPDLIPPKAVSYYKTNVSLGRTDFVNRIPAVSLLAGDTVVEPSAGYILTNDIKGQFLILSSSTADYNFPLGHRVNSTNAQGAATGIVTFPTSVGYGTTGLVKGVLQTVTIINSGSGYSTPGIYTGVTLDTRTGIGTSAAATVTVGAGGSISKVEVYFGGRGFAVNDTLTIRNASRIGGQGVGVAFTVSVQTVQTRLYLALDGSLKFAGSAVIPDYIADASSVGVGTSLQSRYVHTFFPTDISVGGDVDFANDRILVGSGTTFVDGDPVYYETVGNVIGGLTNTNTYFVKRVGISSIELHLTYGLSGKIDLTSSGTNIHYLTRAGVSSSTDRVVFLNHGFTTGDAVQVTGKTPLGISTNSFYYLGAITQNSFAFYDSRDLAIAAVNGVLSTPVGITSAENGTMTLTKQNVAYTSQVNTSSNNPDNWTVLAQNIIDASNITSGTVSPSRLGGGNANSDTFLRGDSVYARVVTSVGIGTTEPFTFSASFQDTPPGGVGITTNYGKVTLAINRVATSQDLYSTLGVSKFKSSTFSIGSDGAVQIKGSATGDVDAVSLGGQVGAYYLDPVNFTSAIPISKGGTGLAALPQNGAILQGNGVSYDLVTAPTLGGNVTLTNNGRFIAVGAALTTITVSGIATIPNSQLTNSVVSGVVTFTASSNNLRQTAGTAELFRLTVSGITTLGSLQATDITSTTLTNNGTLSINNASLTGIVTLSGSGNNFNATAGTQVFNRAVFSGITTFLNTIVSSDASYTTVNVTGTLTPNNLNVTGFTTLTNGFVSGTLALTNQTISGVSTYSGSNNNINQTAGTAALNRLTVAGVSTFTGTLNAGTVIASTLNGSLTGAAGSVTSFDTRASNPNPQDYVASAKFDFKQNTTDGLNDGGTYHGVMSWRSYGSSTDFSGGPMIQLGYTFNGNLYRRMSTSATAWGTWSKLWHDGNDGSGSGLDADTVDGLDVHSGTNNEANKIVRSDASGAVNFGTITSTVGIITNTTNIDRVYCGNNSTISRKDINDFKEKIGLTYRQFTPRSTQTTDINYWNGVMGFGNVDLNTVFDWGSGYVYSNGTPANSPSGATEWVGHQAIHYTNASTRQGWQLLGGGGQNSLWFRSVWGTTFGSWARIWHDANDGAGSGLDADLLDGLNTSSTATGSATVVSRDASGNFAANKIDSFSLTRTNSRTDTAERYPIGHYTPGETVFEIDPTWTQAELQNYFNSANVTWNADATAPGGYAIYINGAVNVGAGAHNSGFPLIPVDTNDIFYMECWIKNVGTSQGHYMGSEEFNESFTTLGGNPGTYGYWVMNNTTSLAAWTKVSGYITGFGASTGQFKTGAKYWTPLALFNFTAGTGTRACLISGWKVIRVSQYGNRTITGNITASGTVTANSDIKLKTNIKPIENALEKVTQMRGVEFDRIDRDNEHQIGVIAQEMEQVVPEIVSDNFGTKAVAYGNLTAVLIEAIKEQQIMINNLKDEIEELKRK